MHLPIFSTRMTQQQKWRTRLRDYYSASGSQRNTDLGGGFTPTSTLRARGPFEAQNRQAVIGEYQKHITNTAHGYKIRQLALYSRPLQRIILIT
jgi:hypothetical protein